MSDDPQHRLLQRLDSVERRLDGIERNGSDHARSLTVLTDEIGSAKGRIKALEDAHVEQRVRVAGDLERDKALQSDISNIKEDIKSIKGLGKWALTTFIGAIILAFVAFMVRGGLT